MMKYCPKCRDYYEDEFLRFCLKDGVPLSSVSQLTEQWNQGKEIIRQTQKRIQKEIRRQKLKRILIMLITTILVMMVVSVMALQTWIYTHPNEVAEITNKKSPPEPTPTEKSEEKRIEIPLEAPLQTPKPTITPTVSPTPKISPTITITPQISPSPTVQKPACNARNKREIELMIEQTKRGYFSNSIANIEKGKAIAFYKENYEVFRVVSFDVNSTNVTYRFESNTCLNVVVAVNFEMLPNTPQLPPRMKNYHGSMKFSCSKTGSNWECQ